MDFPVKMELPKLSHVHIIEMLAPMVPGIVTGTGFALTRTPLFVKFWSLGLGYKSKLTLAIGLMYVLGMAIMALIQYCNLLLKKCFKQPAQKTPWDNSYWRRVAVTYLGRDLSPAAAGSSLEELLRVAESFNPDATPIRPQLASLQAQIEQLESLLKPLKVAESAIAKLPVGVEKVRAEVTELLTASNKAFGEAKSKLETIADIVEWTALSNALDMMNFAASPYTAFGLMMSALQAGGVCALYFLLRFKELRSIEAIIFASLVVACASYGVRLTTIMETYYRNSNAFQTSAMIAEIKRSNPLGDRNGR
jgi:hypothetical protein